MKLLEIETDDGRRVAIIADKITAIEICGRSCFISTGVKSQSHFNGYYVCEDYDTLVKRLEAL